METKHTPWELWESVNGDSDPAPWRIDCGDKVVAWAEDEVNAAHIVKCVNAHDELVAALRCIVEESRCEKAYEIARAALARVK